MTGLTGRKKEKKRGQRLFHHPRPTGKRKREKKVSVYP